MTKKISIHNAFKDFLDSKLSNSRDDLYMQKSLIYNSVSIFALIENVEYIEYNFSGSSYKITSKTIEDNYPHYSEIVQNENINKEKFNQYLENKMNDNEFVETIYQKIFEK